MNSIKKKQIKKAVNLSKQMRENPVGIVTRFMDVENQAQRLARTNKIFIRRLTEERQRFEKLIRFAGVLTAYALSIKTIETLRANNGSMTIKLGESDFEILKHIMVGVESNEAGDPTGITISDAREYKEDCLRREMIILADTLGQATGNTEWATKTKELLSPTPSPEPINEETQDVCECTDGVNHDASMKGPSFTGQLKSL